MPNDITTLLSLLPQVDDKGEIFALHEDGELKKGQLQRFLQLIGPELDLEKGLVDTMPTMIDVDKTDADYLPLIAELVGVKPNREIPIPQFREEIKHAVQWYKRKTLLIGSRIHGYRITRLQTDIVEFWRNIKTSNRTYSFSADNEGTAAINYKLPGDVTAFSYDYLNRDVLSIGGQFASSELVGHESLYAVDGREATYWMSAGAEPQWLAYQFEEATLPLYFKLKAQYGVQDFLLEWSDDGSTWTEAGKYTFGDIAAYTECVGEADGLAQTFYVRRAPVAKSPTPVVFEKTGYAGAVRQLTQAVGYGENQISVDDAADFLADDWLEIRHAGVETGYYRVLSKEGNFVTLSSSIVLRDGYPIFSEVQKVVATAKLFGIDYVFNTWEGKLELLDGQFAGGNSVLVDYDALTDKSSLDVWSFFDVNVLELAPHTHWRLYVETTWLGNPSINEWDLFPDQFFGTTYRGERLGYFFTLGNARPGCKGQIVCNKPLLRETVEKCCNTMREAVPVLATPVMTAIDCKYWELLSPQNYMDSKLDEIYTFNIEQINLSGVLPDNFLLANYNHRRGTPTVSPSMRYYISLLDVNKILEERWYDVIIDRLLISNDILRGSPPLNTIDGVTFISASVRP